MQQAVVSLSKELTDAVIDERHPNTEQFCCQAAVECCLAFPEAGDWAFEDRLLRKLGTVEVCEFGKPLRKLKRIDSFRAGDVQHTSKLRGMSLQQQYPQVGDKDR